MPGLLFLITISSKLERKKSIIDLIVYHNKVIWLLSEFNIFPLNDLHNLQFKVMDFELVQHFNVEWPTHAVNIALKADPDSGPRIGVASPPGKQNISCGRQQIVNFLFIFSIEGVAPRA